MKLSGLIIDLGLILTLLSVTKGQEWTINVTRHINATLGSNVTVRCSFTFPSHLKNTKVIVFWKKTIDTYVFHANKTFVLEMHRGKTSLIGNKDQGDCSLMIQNIREDESMYLRVNVNGTSYSFKNYSVSITLQVASQEWTIIKTYVTIFVPVALLTIMLAAGLIVLKVKRKRTINLPEEEDSGHYANFRRTLSNRAKRGDTCQEQENKVFSDGEPKDPIYMNVEAKVSPEQMSRRECHNESIYENVNSQMMAECCS